MNTEFTIELDKELVNAANEVALAQRKTLSTLVTAYLQSLIELEKEKKFTVSPLVQSLWGSVKMSSDLEPYRDILEKILFDKYAR